MIVNLQQKSIYFLIKAWSYIYIKRHSCNEHDHLVDEAEFLEVNTNYPYIRCADDPETIVSIRDFFAPRQENFQENYSSRDEIDQTNPQDEKNFDAHVLDEDSIDN